MLLKKHQFIVKEKGEHTSVHCVTVLISKIQTHFYNVYNIIIGCGGNINNYESFEECQGVAVTGACCYRQFSRKIEDIMIDSQMETFGCKVMVKNFLIRNLLIF
jgi:hypothetical protein